MIRIIILVVGLFMTSPLSAQERQYGCDALNDGRIYKGSKKSYKYLIEGEGGWLFRSTKDFKADFAFTDKALEQFSTFNKILQKKGITLHIVMPPTRGILNYDQVLRTQKRAPDFNPDTALREYKNALLQLRLSGVSVADFNDFQKLKEGFFYPRDHHWTAMGANYAAKATAALFKLFSKDYDTAVYITEQTNEQVELSGSMEAFVEQQCGIDVEGSKVQVIQTYKEEELFDDSSAAAIALIGTSNCTEPAPSYANFAGFLREYIGADIDNLSFGGAGIYAPMLSFLASDAYHEGQYQHIIWELASHYDFNGREFSQHFQQMIAAARGACDDISLASEKRDLKGKKMIRLGLPPVTSLSYIHLQFDTPLKKDFALSYKNAEGKPKRFRFERSQRYPHDGTYFVNWLEDTGRISDIKLFMPATYDAEKVRAQICPIQD